MDRIYFEVNADGLIIGITDYEISSSNEVIIREQSAVEEPYDLIGRQKNYIDLPIGDRPERTTNNPSPSKSIFDKLRLAKTELILAEDLEEADILATAQANYGRLLTEFNVRYVKGETVTTPPGI